MWRFGLTVQLTVSWSLGPLSIIPEMLGMLIRFSKLVTLPMKLPTLVL